MKFHFIVNNLGYIIYPINQVFLWHHSSSLNKGSSEGYTKKKNIYIYIYGYIKWIYIWIY